MYDRGDQVHGGAVPSGHVSSQPALLIILVDTEQNAKQFAQPISAESQTTGPD